jgi:predicted TIM-barrel fold metal-dependent hydrolase
VQIVQHQRLLPDWIDMTRALIGDLSPDEQTAIASGNARRRYAI